MVTSGLLTCLIVLLWLNMKGILVLWNTVKKREEGICSGNVPRSKLCGGIQGRAVINWHWQSNDTGQLLVIYGCLFKSKATQVLLLLLNEVFPCVILLFINTYTRKAESVCLTLWSSSSSKLAWRMMNYWDLKIINWFQAWKCADH